jgi:hypothetical protein
MDRVEQLPSAGGEEYAPFARLPRLPRHAGPPSRRCRSGRVLTLGGILFCLLVASSARAQRVAGPPAKAYRYAQTLLQRYDRNGDGKLQKDEWSQLPGASKGLDANADQEVTVEELVRWMMVYGAQRRLQPGWLPPTPEPEAVPAGKDSGESAKEQVETPPSPKERPADGPRTTVPSPTPDTTPRRPKRFHLSPSRIPPGLPEWFLSRDADGDGQLTLSEYASGGTAFAQQEFARLDLNGDGVVTPQEYLKINKPAKAAKPPAKP